MIVKNEAHLILKTLRHLAKFIQFDYWVINDNGSTDGTQNIIRKYFQEKGIPGELDETPWRDFAFNRTLVFKRAFNKTDYAFVWDADDEISGDFQFPLNPTADQYTFIFGNAAGSRYVRLQLFNNHKQWKYVGVLHEYPTADVDANTNEPPRTESHVSGSYFFISGRTGARNKNPNKYLHDAEILEKAYTDAKQTGDPIMNRYAFYTAQSYNSANKHEKAIEYYKIVVNLETSWAQERYVSCMEIFDQSEKMNDTTQLQNALPYLVLAHKFDSRRIECIYRLVKYYCVHGMNDVAFAYYDLIREYYENEYPKENDGIATRLFAKKEEYDFYLPYYMIIVSERMNTTKLKTARTMYEMIFKQGYTHAGSWWIHNLFTNLQFCLPAITEQEETTTPFIESLLVYHDKVRAHNPSFALKPNHYGIMDKIVMANRGVLTRRSSCALQPQPSRSDPVRILFTITTCKRLNLFQETMRSVLQTWAPESLNSVDVWFCIDDNSTAEDRKQMAEEFTFFDFYWKTPAEKGHRKSMNIIWNKICELNPTWWVHLEDDWLFFKKEDYIGRGIALLEKYKNHNIHQIAFNREYGLMLDDMNFTSGILLEQGVWLHTMVTPPTGKHCAYWPHYTLQPSIIRASVIMSLGDYTSSNTFFERDYADKYAKAGYKTAFFNEIYAIHIGKQRWEKDKLNAYALNGDKQFDPIVNPTLVITEETDENAKT